MAWFSGPTRHRVQRGLGALILLAIIVVGLSIPLRYWQAEANYRAAQAALRKDHLVDARHYLEKYLAHHPNSYSGHLLMARIARRAGYLDEAAVHLDICEWLSGPTAEIQREHFLARAQNGDLSQAESLWSQARQDPDQAGEIFRALSQGYRKNFLLEKMRLCLDAWLESEPGNSQALVRRGWVRERQKDYQAAVEDYQRALDADPDCHEALLRKAQALLFLKRPAEALKDLEILHQHQPADPETGVTLAQCWLNLDRAMDAQELLDQLIQANPREFPLLLEQGHLALEQSRLEQAEDWLRRAVAQRPHDHQANVSLHRALAGQGKKTQAEEIRAQLKRIEADLKRMAELTERLQQRPLDPNLRCEIGKVFLRLGEKKEGVLWLQSALRADPHFRPAHEALAAYYDEHHQPALAARHRRQGR